MTARQRGAARVDLSVLVTPEVKDRARSAVAALRGVDHAVDGGLSGMVERLLEREVARLERKHTAGGPFPAVAQLARGPAPKRPRSA